MRSPRGKRLPIFQHHTLHIRTVQTRRRFTVNPAMAPEVKAALLSRWEPVHRSQLHYLVTWYTRGRRPVLKDRHLETLGSMIESLCEERGITLLESTAAQ